MTGAVCRASTQAGAETLTELAPTLTCDHEAPLLFEWHSQDTRATGPLAVAPTVVAYYGRGGGNTPMIVQENRAATVRWLLPAEAGRLQGFPDGWGEVAPLDTTDAEAVAFWQQVYKTDRAIKGAKPAATILADAGRLARWHDSLHTVSAEHRMWGNGMALPNALFFVEQAIGTICAEEGWTPDSVKLGSLFDGSGTMPLAAEMAGARAVWASEVEPYPIAVTCTHLPEMRHLGSVTDIDGSKIEPVDIIAFGSPCQDLSIAGPREGLSGKRSGLFMQAIRIIGEMLTATGGRFPRFAIWENVTGALTSQGGADFETVLNELLQLSRPNEFIRQHGRWPGAGAFGAIAYRTVNAQYWGVPQRRRRIYAIADFRGESADLVAFEREGAAWSFEPRIPPRKTVAALVAGCYQWHDRMVAEGKRGGVRSYTLKIRSGCEGGGKGALVQTEKSATLTAHPDQALITINPSNEEAKR